MGGKCVRLWEWWRDKAHRHEACRHGVHCWLADWVRGSAALIFPSAWQLDRFPPLPFSSPSLHLRTTTFCHYPGKPWIAWSLGTGGRGPLPVHMCAHVCMCVHTHMCTCVYMPVVRVRTHACKCAYMYICRCVYSSMCACMRLYKHLYVYLYRLVILSSLFFHLLAWPLHLSLKFSLHLAFKYHSLCCCWSTYSLIMTPSSWHIWALWSLDYSTLNGLHYCVYLTPWVESEFQRQDQVWVIFASATITTISGAQYTHITNNE